MICRSNLKFTLNSLLTLHALNQLEEDVLRCTPRSLRDNGRVSILWHKSLAKKLTDTSTDSCRHTADRPICFRSVYLPTCMGCTDNFKECMDYLDAVLGHLAF